MFGAVCYIIGTVMFLQFFLDGDGWIRILAALVAGVCVLGFLYFFIPFLSRLLSRTH